MMFKDYIQDPNIFQIINPVSVGIKKWKYSGTSCVWAANRLRLEAEAELLKLSSYDVW